MEWNEGYRTDITYTYGYYNEMNPAGMRFILTMAGLAAPYVNHACELGYGQGLSINIHAAAEDISWIGTDFNPSQAAFAQAMAAASGANAVCYADSFHDFCERKDLPDFDYIALHGIWSWISPENQAAITRLLDKKLRVGGVLYISYNANPGWAPFHPLRDLMQLYVEREGAAGRNILSRIEDAFAWMNKVTALKPAYLVANPSVDKKMEQFKDKDSAYLAHEFFNKDWHPSNFQEMVAILSQARMTFACSATPLMAIPGLGLNEEQRKILNESGDPVLKETLSDFIRNTQFRKDYWIKGPRPLSAVERVNLLRQEQLILISEPGKITREIKTGSGNISISEAACEIFATTLSDGKVHTLADLERTAHELAQKPDKPEGIEKENINSLAHIVCALIAAGIVAIAQKKQEAQKARSTSEKLNAFIETRAITSGEINYLASPVTGGGIQASRFDMLFLLALRRGAKTVANLAAFAKDCLDLAGQSILKNGEPITDHNQALAWLEDQAESFNRTRLPVFKNLLIS